MSPLEAVHDLAIFYQLKDDTQVAMSLHEPPTASGEQVRLKVFRRNQGIELSDMIPMLENLGFRVLEEHPFRIEPQDEDAVWMQDFMLSYRARAAGSPDIASVKAEFSDAFYAIWKNDAENDAFNRLVVGTGLHWREVSVLRAYARYLKQLGTAFSLDFIADTLIRYSHLAKALVLLFLSRLDPQMSDADTSEPLRKEIEQGLDTVAGINEDQVLRLYIDLIMATRRTNFFLQGAGRRGPPTLALKIGTRDLSFVPFPRPEFEIFVYSTRVEGVHLCAGKIARGGIRWSDRVEDFRTEILGLVKAQQVKNSVIVPTGAKGGFIARKASVAGDRDAFLREGQEAYKLFIGALLDVTDNLSGDELVHPQDVKALDGDDPYLVVAADKGTASYSDTANSISAQRNFWLGDAFASGGSQGYDHKKMGITARGAWIAVQRHFRELDINIQETPFDVVGIGDMSGDVFGNGMLLSPVIRLVAAFNHVHIFIDPDPDPAASWAERKRLFEMPRSGWTDYDSGLISAGGGVFSRSQKRIPVSAAMAARFDISEPQISPDQLIKHLIKARVDLLWNGGIGTYVKAKSETHANVGYRACEALRVNGSDLRCRVFGEGGNLGMTQLGRIEYCHAGGICNTDFIHNAAGVDCSDHEVNLRFY